MDVHILEAAIVEANAEGLRLLRSEIALNRINLGSLRNSLQQDADHLSGDDVMRVERNLSRATSIVAHSVASVANLPDDPNQRLAHLTNALETVMRIREGKPH